MNHFAGRIIVVLVCGLTFSGAAIAEVSLPALPAYEPFADERALLETIKVDPSKARRQALAALRRKYVAVLRSMAEGDTKSAAFQRAILYAESAAKLDPANIDGWMLYGSTLLAVPQWPLTQSIAEEVFRIVLDIEPKNTDAGVYLGQALFNQQRFDAARAQWTHVFRSFPKAATPERMGPLSMAIILSGEIEDGIDLFRDLNAVDRRPHLMLAQGLLTKHMMDMEPDPRWRLDFTAIDAYMLQKTGEEAQYWADMKKKWKAGAK
jgi:tetratricopeptide (TPR) repeat protein